MQDFLNKTFSFTPESIEQLKAIRLSNRWPSDSHTLRELIRKEAKKLKRETA
jgi:hypothetical protein